MAKILGGNFNAQTGSGVYMYCENEEENATLNRASGLTDTYVWNFFTGRDDRKAMVVASDEYAAILVDYVLDGAFFYYDSINIERTVPVAGATPAGKPLSKWVITVGFKNSTAAEEKRESLILKPSEKPPGITWTSRTTEMAAVADAYGKAYMNTAGDYFDGMSRLADEYIYKFSFNIALPVLAVSGGEPRSRADINTDVAALNAGSGYEPWWLFGLSNTTNLYPVQIRGSYWPANTLRAGGFASGNVAVEAGEVYIPVSWEMVGHTWKWNREVANVGTNSLHFTVLAGALDGTYVSNVWTPGVRPSVNSSVDGEQMFDFFMGDATLNGGNTNPDYVQDLVNTLFRDRNRIAIAKRPIFGVSDPVFLDGWGQYNSQAIPPGFLRRDLGVAVAAPGSDFATTSFNVYDYLGARMDDGNGNVYYIPNKPEDLRDAQNQAGWGAWAVDFAAKSSLALPLTSTKRNAGTYVFDPSPFVRNFAFQYVEGDTLLFQDYLMRDHTALPGVYYST